MIGIYLALSPEPQGQHIHQESKHGHLNDLNDLLTFSVGFDIARRPFRCNVMILQERALLYYDKGRVSLLE